MAKKRASSLITKEQWMLLYKLQKGKCPICLQNIHIAGNIEGKRAASVDHSHTAPDKGRVRGLLCHHCNRHRVGNNTPETASRLFHYLTSTMDGRLL